MTYWLARGREWGYAAGAGRAVEFALKCSTGLAATRCGTISGERASAGRAGSRGRKALWKTGSGWLNLRMVSSGK